mmetsp:Transcript_30970/g.52303  ORF Transcript_30970/g.52303 Transcript_30970/m.52303 type:complete len:201 (+) Transcript_30970:856-1458(+)
MSCLCACGFPCYGGVSDGVSFVLRPLTTSRCCLIQKRFRGTTSVSASFSGRIVIGVGFNISTFVIVGDCGNAVSVSARVLSVIEGNNFELHAFCKFPIISLSLRRRSTELSYSFVSDSCSSHPSFSFIDSFCSDSFKSIALNKFSSSSSLTSSSSSRARSAASRYLSHLMASHEFTNRGYIAACVPTFTGSMMKMLKSKV